MKHYTLEELEEVKRLHKMWLNNEDGGERADLQCADLQGVNLQCADLQCADLQDANLRGADLWDANLRGADLQCANLQDDLKVKTFAVFTGLYTYIAMPIIAEDGTEWVRLGCYWRTVKGWESDFWNNPREFPNDGSVKSKDRLNAYQTCLRWLEARREKP